MSRCELFCSICKKLLLSIIFFNYTSGYAQIIIKDTYLDIFASTYVKSIDEFMQRFNADELHPDLDTTRVENVRLHSILTLFDLQQFQVRDSIVAKQLISFADTVCQKDVRLDFESGLYAEATCTFIFHDKELPINLVFVYEPVQNDIYRWALAGVNGLQENHILDTSRNGYINPTQHEVRFTELSTASANLTNYVSNHKSIDQMSYLLGMLESNQLKYVDCQKVRFHFLQVPGYIFIVDEVNRLSNNAGYLISSLIKTERPDKLEFINQLLGSKSN